MNKLVAGAVAGLALGAMSTVSALDMSAGGGVSIGYDIVGQGTSAKYTGSYSWAGDYASHDWEIANGVPQTYVGVHGFFDATFVEVGVGLGWGFGYQTLTLLRDGERIAEGKWGNYELSTTNLGISVLGKYNIPVREGMEVFPAVGFEYDLCLSATATDSISSSYKNEKGDDAAIDLSQFVIKLGVGWDYELPGNTYIRLLALYGLGAPSKYSSDAAKADDNDEYKAAWTSNVQVKVGLGFKF